MRTPAKKTKGAAKKARLALQERLRQRGANRRRRRESILIKPSCPVPPKPSEANPVAKIVKPVKPLNLRAEVCGVLRCSYIKAYKKAEAYGYGYVGDACFSREDLEANGYAFRNGTTVSVVIQWTSHGQINAKIIERLDTDLRIQSDMRLKPAWRALPWLEPAIAAIYHQRDEISRATGIPHEVDHIYPINHPLSCGLTVPWNLQVIPAVENRRKSNKISRES